MKPISAEAKIPDAIVINKAIMEYMTVKAAEHVAEIDAFVESSNKTNLMLMEVFKGLVTSVKA
jgi:hypothetical protein